LDGPISSRTQTFVPEAGDQGPSDALHRGNFAQAGRFAPCTTGASVKPSTGPLSIWRQAVGADFEPLPPLQQEEIAARAYAKSLNRPPDRPSPVDDWLEAEQELRREQLASLAGLRPPTSERSTDERSGRKSETVEC